MKEHPHVVTKPNIIRMPSETAGRYAAENRPNGEDVLIKASTPEFWDIFCQTSAVWT
jgi:hypothetical protein